MRRFDFWEEFLPKVLAKSGRVSSSVSPDLSSLDEAKPELKNRKCFRISTISCSAKNFDFRLPNFDFLELNLTSISPGLCEAKKKTIDYSKNF